MDGIRGVMAADSDGRIPDRIAWPDEAHAFMYEGTAGFIAGPSGTSKSLAVCKIIADWTRTSRGRVVASLAEDGEGMNKYRLEASGADMSKVRLARYMLPDDYAALESDMRALGETLAVFDTAAKHIRGPVARWAQALDGLTGVLDRTGATAIFTHHTVKNMKKNADWRAAIGGTADGLPGTCRWGALYGVRPDESEHRLLAPVKDQYDEPNSAVAFEFEVEDFDVPKRDGSGTVSKSVSYLKIAEKGVKIGNPVELAFLGGENAARGPSQEKRAEAAQWIVEHLADGARAVRDCFLCPTDGHIAGRIGQEKGACPYCNGPLTAVAGLQEDCEGDGLSWGTVKRAQAAIGVVAGRKGSSSAPGGLMHYWHLPDGHPGITDPANYGGTLT